jgi:hypothetical protein
LGQKRSLQGDENEHRPTKKNVVNSDPNNDNENMYESEVPVNTSADLPHWIGMNNVQNITKLGH